MQIGLVSDTAIFAIFASSYLIGRIMIIIVITETTAQDIPHPTLGILHIRGYRTGFCHHCLDFVTDTVRESRAVGR